jgi:hypothetical protein
MTRYIYLILLPLGLACASSLPARATRCTISEAHTRYRWHTGCADADLHQADAPAAKLVRASLMLVRNELGSPWLHLIKVPPWRVETGCWALTFEKESVHICGVTLLLRAGLTPHQSQQCSDAV